jgi:hypothetical protein
MRALGRLALGAFLALHAAAAPAQDEAATGAEAPEWDFGASVYGYFPPDDTWYGQPTLTADYGALHLEGRYNYEGLQTGSAWIGGNIGIGEALRLDLTLMAGGIFGDQFGVAPGYELTLSWRDVELYSEGEFVFDTGDLGDHFFYTWSQLGYSPLDWLSLGLASQRTRAYETELDVQRGVFVGLAYRRLSLTAYVFNLGWETPTVVAALAATF